MPVAVSGPVSSMRGVVAVVHGLGADQRGTDFAHDEIAAVLHAGVVFKVEVLGEDLLAPALPLLVVDAHEVARPELTDLVDVAEPLHLGLQGFELRSQCVVGHRDVSSGSVGQARAWTRPRSSSIMGTSCGMRGGLRPA